MQSKIIIEAQDCLPIKCNEEVSAALFYFVSSISSNIYHFSKKQKDEEPIVYFDYQNRQWMANRYIGECEFVFNNQNYILKIAPRFGHELLLKIYEYIYSTKLPPSLHTLAKIKAIDIHKLLISVIWTSYLKKGLKHGLYKINKQIKEQGTVIRGKFLVRDSLISIKANNNLFYSYAIKEIDNIPNNILIRAYVILKKNYFLNESFLSNSIKMDLKRLSNILDLNSNLVYNDYKKIKYSNLYAIYKPLIDLSWEIITNKHLGINQSEKVGNSFFLDMAELWEFFIHKILGKSLIPLGWSFINNELAIYESTFYKRKLIPDIILERNDKILVFDAKYKRMNYSNLDVDRDDVFQIHTYSYYFDKLHKEIHSGLIYPLEHRNEKELEKHTILTKANNKSYFFIEGLEVNNPDLFEQNIECFINAIKLKLN